MGDFLAIIPSRGTGSKGEEFFRRGLETANIIGKTAPEGTVETDWCHAAVFPRLNGTGASLVTDPATGSWLLTVGTWFHVDGWGPGDERRLLGRLLQTGPRRLGLELEGFFTIVAGDGMGRQMIVITDIAGSCHCFARELNGGTAISGSSLLLAALDEITLDPVGCQEFLYTGIIYEDRTFFREVRKLRPATIFRYTADSAVKKDCYWSIKDIEPESLHGSAAVDSLGRSLAESVGRIGRVYTNPVCDLTGGYDSRAIAAAFLTAGVDFSTTVTGPPESSDVKVSEGLAKRLGLEHLRITPLEGIAFDRLVETLPLTDGECDMVEYSRVLDVHRTLSGRFDISINGSFGEVARGYWWELLFPRAGERRRLDPARLSVRRYAAQSFNPSIFLPETSLDLVSHLSEVIESTIEGLHGLPNTLQMDHTYLMMRMQRWQGRIATSTNRIWPCLSPFIFRSTLETVLRADTRVRRHGLLIRMMLKEFQPVLAEFPLEHGWPALPLTYRNFYRFWPVPVFYGRKVASRASRKLGLNRAQPPGPSSARLSLWEDERVKSLLDPSAMGTSHMMDRSRLEEFLRLSRTASFPYDAQWRRLISLEYTLSSLRGIEASKNTGSPA